MAHFSQYFLGHTGINGGGDISVIVVNISDLYLFTQKSA